MADNNDISANGSRARAIANAPGFGPGMLEVLGALSDQITGGVRGATKATLGAPGDLMSLLGKPAQRYNLPMEALYDLPTSEDFERWLPQGTRFSGPGKQPQEALTQYAPLTPGQAMRVAKPVGQLAKSALTMLGESMAAKAPAAVPAGQLGAVRLRGGNMDQKTVDAELARMGHSTEHGSAVNTWLDKQMRNYLTKEYGSTTDPMLQVEKEGLLHLTPQQLEEKTQWISEPDNVAAAHAKLTNEPLTPWGRLAAENIYTEPLWRQAVRWNPEKPMPEWMGKADPNTPMHNLEYGDTGELGHIVDYLEAASSAHRNLVYAGGPDELAKMVAERVANPDWGRALEMHNAGLMLLPEQIAKTSVADAARKTNAWNKLLEEKMNNANAGGLNNTAVLPHKDYPEQGMRWVQLGGDDKDALSAALNAEGTSMGHCVGGYCDDVTDRGVKIYSLRDAKNNPHVTIEVSPENKMDPYRWYEWQPIEAKRALRDRVWPANVDDKLIKDLIKDSPEYQEYMAQPVRDSVQQIKGKQNAAPVAQYRPFVQDFIRSGDWSKVHDLDNAGFAPGEYTPPGYAGGGSVKLDKAALRARLAAKCGK